MAKKNATNSKQTKQKNIDNIDTKITNKDKFRFIFGIGLLFFSVFLIISIISYCKTWSQDQSHILSSESVISYLLYNDDVVMNWCGRLGATLSHVLVYESIGLMAFVLCIWLGLLALNILYGYYAFPARKWFRWLMFGILFISPLLSLILHRQNFPYGGVFGQFITSWTFGFAGHIGTWFILITIGLIFSILVFQWDLKPYFDRLKAASLSRIQAYQEQRKREVLLKQQHQASESPFETVPTQTTKNNFSSTDDQDAYPSTLSVNDVYITQNEYVDTDNSSTSTPSILQENETDVATSDLELVELNDETVVSIPESPVLSTTSEDTVTSNISSEEETPTILVNKGSIVIEVPQPIEDTSHVDNTTSALEHEHTISVSSDKDVENVQSENEVKEEAKTQENNSIAGLELIQVKDDDTVNVDGKKSIADISNLDPYDPDLDLRDYKFPILDLLEAPQVEGIALDAEELAKNKEQITNTLKSFGIEIQRIQATVGPTVTLYEIVPQEGVRISKIRNLEDDIALNLAALGIRMIAPIPGKGTIGIEVPNARKQIVPMRTLLSSEKFINNSMSLPIALGKKIDNENYIVDLATMPHLLMAGATGQGKSVGINAILVSLLYKKHPSQLKFVLVDPKKVELSIYKHIENHYLAKLPNEEEAIITDTKKVINTLSSLCIEMDNRYELLKDAGTRNIKEYNAKFISRKLSPERGHKYLPFIVLVIDEFADLIMTAGKEVEAPVARLAQLARAVGIHLIVATQRPSVNVITGIIKANFPARIAFRVTSKVDSRTILDTGGADQLIGRGDMLVSVGSDLMRVQCAFVDTPEVEKIVEFIGEQRGFAKPYELPEYEGAEDEEFEKKDVDLSKRDKLFEECARLVVNSQSGSTSMLQRKFNLGYNRAGRIMDQLEAAGIVGAQSGSKPRDVLVSSETELEQILSLI